MRILYLHNQMGISGGERSLLNLWAHLDRTLFEPVVMLPGPGAFAEAAKGQGVDVYMYAVPPVRLASAERVLRSAFFLARFIRRNQIRIIHSYGPRNNIVAAAAAAWCRIPVIWHERNIPVDGERDVTREFIRMPDAVICNSQAVARRFEKSGKRPAKVRVILNGVDTERFRPTPPDAILRESLSLNGSPVVGLMTTLSARRRVEFFIHAAEQIHTRRGDVRFLIVGDDFGGGPGSGRRQTVEALIRERGLQDFIHMTGFQDDVIPYIALCTVCCQVTANDACSRSVLEYMAMAKPVVAIRDGGNPELIEDGVSGLLTDSDDEAFVRQVMSLLEHPEHAQALGAAARQRVVDRFDARRNAGKTQELYQELLRRKGGVCG